MTPATRVAAVCEQLNQRQPGHVPNIEPETLERMWSKAIAGADLATIDEAAGEATCRDGYRTVRVRAAGVALELQRLARIARERLFSYERQIAAVSKKHAALAALLTDEVQA